MIPHTTLQLRTKSPARRGVPPYGALSNCRTEGSLKLNLVCG
jgi:hypothetical protein